jgi:hypothetical protein
MGEDCAAYAPEALCEAVPRAVVAGRILPMMRPEGFVPSGRFLWYAKRDNVRTSGCAAIDKGYDGTAGSG